jgi:hypothetical protein
MALDRATSMSVLSSTYSPELVTQLASTVMKPMRSR